MWEWEWVRGKYKCSEVPGLEKNDRPWKGRHHVIPSKHNTSQRQHCLLSDAAQYDVIFPHTFTLVVREDRLVFLHDVGEEESFSDLTLWLNAAAQVGPEGGFEREVPWSWDAIFSWWVKKKHRLLGNAWRTIQRQIYWGIHKLWQLLQQELEQYSLHLTCYAKKVLSFNVTPICINVSIYLYVWYILT